MAVNRAYVDLPVAVTADEYNTIYQWVADLAFSYSEPITIEWKIGSGWMTMFVNDTSFEEWEMRVEICFSVFQDTYFSRVVLEPKIIGPDDIVSVVLMAGWTHDSVPHPPDLGEIVQGLYYSSCCGLYNCYDKESCSTGYQIGRSPQVLPMKIEEPKKRGRPEPPVVDKPAIFTPESQSQDNFTFPYITPLSLTSENEYVGNGVISKNRIPSRGLLWKPQTPSSGITSTPCSACDSPVIDPILLRIAKMQAVTQPILLNLAQIWAKSGN